MANYTIGALSRATGTKVPTIRYYEQAGLIAAPMRTEGGQRRYTDADVTRLSFIRHARGLGFSLPSIRELLALADDPGGSCAEADALTKRHLADVEARLQRLHALKSELERMLAECAGGSIKDCRVIEILGDHAQCLSVEHHT